MERSIENRFADMTKGAATGATIAGVTVSTFGAVLVGAILAGLLAYLASSKR